MKTADFSDAQLVGDLDRLVGLTLIALVARMTNRRKTLSIKVGDDRLDPEERKRLELAYDLFNDVAEAKGENYARSWFIGANTEADEVSPCEAIREGRFEDVRISARRAIDPEEMGG